MATRDDEGLLIEVRDRLVRATGAERVILFGSRARGDARGDSDYDLVVVTGVEEDPWAISSRAHQALFGLGISADIVVFSPEAFATRSQWISSVARRAVEDGRVLYEAA